MSNDISAYFVGDLPDDLSTEEYKSILEKKKRFDVNEFIENVSDKEEEEYFKEIIREIFEFISRPDINGNVRERIIKTQKLSKGDSIWINTRPIQKAYIIKFKKMKNGPPIVIAIIRLLESREVGFVLLDTVKTGLISRNIKKNNKNELVYPLLTYEEINEFLWKYYTIKITNKIVFDEIDSYEFVVEDKYEWVPAKEKNEEQQEV